MISGVTNYGEIAYDDEGKPICHICGKSFNSLMTHVRQKHGMSAFEYKKEFGLETTKGIESIVTKEKRQNSVAENFDKVVRENLLNKGIGTRFKKGCTGRTKDMMSYQTIKNIRNKHKALNRA